MLFCLGFGPLRLHHHVQAARAGVAECARHVMPFSVGLARTVAKRLLESNRVFQTCAGEGAEPETLRFATGNHHLQRVAAFYYVQCDAVAFLPGS